MANAISRRYDATTIALHWLTAGLVVLLWIIGQTADWAPRGPLQTPAVRRKASVRSLRLDSFKP